MRDSKELLSKLDMLYDTRTKYLESAKKGSKKLIGYLCSFVPAELIAAAGFLPVRITGNPRVELSKAAEYIEPNLCPYVSNCFELIIDNRYKLLDGIVLSAACDAVERVYGMLSFYKKADFLHFIHVPHTVTVSSKNFYKQELEMFAKKMETSFGISLSDEKIRNAIKLYNENKELIKKFYGLRKIPNPVIKGSEMMKLLTLGMTMSAPDYNALLKDLYKSWSAIREQQSEPKVRILLMGCITDNIALMELIESSNATIVVDDMCIGTKTYFNLAKGDDPFAALTDAYFTDFMCPRTFSKTGKEGFDYLLNLISEYQVDGVIVYHVRFCDPHGFDYPLIRDILKERRVPVLRIEDDYRLSNFEALRTRTQAFVEVIAQGLI